MFRVLALTSLLAVAGLATPAAADGVDVGDTCSHLAITFTESDETHADVYINKVVNYQGAPDEAEIATMHLMIVEALKELAEPQEVSQGKYTVQVNLQFPHHDDPEVTGIRVTYAVNVVSCTGL